MNSLKQFSLIFIGVLSGSIAVKYAIFKIKERQSYKNNIQYKNRQSNNNFNDIDKEDNMYKNISSGLSYNNNGNYVNSSGSNNRKL